jgi:hypothetical protein
MFHCPFEKLSAQYQLDLLPVYSNYGFQPKIEIIDWYTSKNWDRSYM